MNRKIKWINDIPFPYRKAISREILIILLIWLLGSLTFFEIHSGKIIFLGTSDAGFFLFFSIYIVAIFILIGFASLPILLEYLDYKFYAETEDEIIFSNIIEMYGTGNDPIGKVLKKRTLRRYVFKGKSQIYTGILGVHKKRFVRIICTPTRKTYFKLLFFPREENNKQKRKVKKYDFMYKEAFTPYDTGRNTKSYPLKVVYTKFNHYFVRIELLEGIDYPENFATLIMRINEFI